MVRNATWCTSEEFIMTCFTVACTLIIQIIHSTLKSCYHILIIKSEWGALLRKQLCSVLMMINSISCFCELSNHSLKFHHYTAPQTLVNSPSRCHPHMWDYERNHKQRKCLYEHQWLCLHHCGYSIFKYNVNATGLTNTSPLFGKFSHLHSSQVTKKFTQWQGFWSQL